LTPKADHQENTKFKLTMKSRLLIKRKGKNKYKSLAVIIRIAVLSVVKVWVLSPLSVALSGPYILTLYVVQTIGKEGRSGGGIILAPTGHFL